MKNWKEFLADHVKSKLDSGNASSQEIAESFLLTNSDVVEAAKPDVFMSALRTEVKSVMRQLSKVPEQEMMFDDSDFQTIITFRDNDGVFRHSWSKNANLKQHMDQAHIMLKNARACTVKHDKFYEKISEYYPVWKENPDWSRDEVVAEIKRRNDGIES